MAQLRPDFLVHWTGKDIERQHRGDDTARQKAYYDRLRRTLLGDPDHPHPTTARPMPGLWMKWLAEPIRGRHGVTLARPDDKGRPYVPAVPVTCFTEIHLSQVSAHTARYGQLGFGFSRAFVLNRSGLPVQYVSGTDSDVIVGNAASLLGMFGDLGRGAAVREEHASPSGFVLDDALSELRRATDGDSRLAGILDDLLLWIAANKRVDIQLDTIATPSKMYEECCHRLDMNCAFLKVMSDCPEDTDMLFLDEQEWRIVHTHGAEKRGLLSVTGIQSINLPSNKVPFGACHLKVLVFPDDETRQRALDDEDLVSWFRSESGNPRFPAMVTVDECAHF